MNQEKIGNFIAEKRKEKNLTQEQLAEKLGVTNRAISNWENGKNMPDLSLFKPLCDELDISINDLMSGEKIDNQHYINSLEENVVNMVSNLEKKNKRNNRVILISIIIIILSVIIFRYFYICYEIDVKYDKRVMGCEINDKEINFMIKGQSMLKTYHTIKKLDDEKIYFFHSTVSVYQKRRSRWEYFESMARLLENEEVPFGSKEILDVTDNNIKVYYTDYSIQKIKKANEKELRDIIKKSYLMCSN